MSVVKPFKRTCRAFLDGDYSTNGRSAYILHPDFSTSPEHYIRAFEVLQKDFLELLDYIEPADRNLQTFSFRTHSLLMRTCIEVEANFKAIFIDNGLANNNTQLNMADYRKLNPTHHLSSYEVALPLWHGARGVRVPFAAWRNNRGIAWYTAYNKSKHNRHGNFQDASFEHTLDSICGLVALLASQFHLEDFVPGGSIIVTSNRVQDGFETAIGNYFRVKFPADWAPADAYDFNWANLSTQPNPTANLVV